MKHEREPRPRLTLERVADRARETALHDGGHAPMLIVAGTRQSVILQFEALADTHEERAEQMATAGFSLAQDWVIGVPDQVFFITEGWISQLEAGQEPVERPSQDPNRVEALVIAGLDLRDQVSRGILFKMVRNAEGQLTALEPYLTGEDAEPPGEMESPLLLAFVQGFALGVTDRRD